MENNNFKNEKQQHDFKYYIFVFQAIFVSVFIFAVLIIKFIGGNIYSDIKQWYNENFTNDTSLSDVMGPYSDYSDYGSDDYTVFSK